MIVRNLVLGMLVGLLVAGAPHASAQSPPPMDVVKSAVEEVLALLADGSLDAGERRRRLRDAIAPHFDFEAMSRSILATHWKKAAPQERERFVALFQKLLEDTYITAMEEYSGETIRYGKEKVDDNRAVVETFIVRGNAVEIPVSYRLSATEGRWRATDVSVEGVSLVSNYRSSFRSIVRKSGMSGLLEQLDKKVNASN